MKENVDKLICELAQKLGVTVEHLWQVLLNQAPVTGTITVIGWGIWVACLVGCFRFIYLQQEHWDDDFVARAWTVWGFAAAITVIVTICEAPLILATFFNPEYWALMQLR